MTTLDVADLMVIAGAALGIGPDAALARADITAAQAALAEAGLTEAGPAGTAPAEAGPAGTAPAEAGPAGASLTGTGPTGHQPGAGFSDRAAAAAAGIGLVHALLRHRPFPGHGEQVAVAAGLQFLSLNGWQADLDPPATAAVVVEALASGRLAPDRAAAWLSPRLSPGPAARARPLRIPRPSLRPLRALPVAGLTASRRKLASAALAVAIGGLALLATACSRGPAAPAFHPGGAPPAVRPTAGPAQASQMGYAACMRSYGIADFPAPLYSGTVVITPAVGIDLNSPRFLTAQQACLIAGRGKGG